MTTHRLLTTGLFSVLLLGAVACGGSDGDENAAEGDSTSADVIEGEAGSDDTDDTDDADESSDNDADGSNESEVGDSSTGGGSTTDSPTDQETEEDEIDGSGAAATDTDDSPTSDTDGDAGSDGATSDTDEGSGSGTSTNSGASSSDGATTGNNTTSSGGASGGDTSSNATGSGGSNGASSGDTETPANTGNAANTGNTAANPSTDDPDTDSGNTGTGTSAGGGTPTPTTAPAAAADPDPTVPASTTPPVVQEETSQQIDISACTPNCVPPPYTIAPVSAEWGLACQSADTLIGQAYDLANIAPNASIDGPALAAGLSVISLLDQIPPGPVDAEVLEIETVLALFIPPKDVAALSPYKSNFTTSAETALAHAGENCGVNALELIPSTFITQVHSFVFAGVS